jgi:hypothetical protein
LPRPARSRLIAVAAANGLGIAVDEPGDLQAERGK